MMTEHELKNPQLPLLAHRRTVRFSLYYRRDKRYARGDKRYTRAQIIFNAKAIRDFGLKDGMRCKFITDSKGELYITFGDETLTGGNLITTHRKYKEELIEVASWNTPVIKRVCDRWKSKSVTCPIALTPKRIDGVEWWHILTSSPYRK